MEKENVDMKSSFVIIWWWRVLRKRCEISSFTRFETSKIDAYEVYLKVENIIRLENVEVIHYFKFKTIPLSNMSTIVY